MKGRANGRDSPFSFRSINANAVMEGTRNGFVYLRKRGSVLLHPYMWMAIKASETMPTISVMMESNIYYLVKNNILG